MFTCCTYIPYIPGTYLLYIHEVILSIISPKKEKTLSSSFVFSPMKSQRGEGKKGKGKKKEKEEEKGNPFHILPTLPRDVGFFLSFFFKKIY